MWTRLATEFDLPKCPWCGRAGNFVSYAGPTEINVCRGCSRYFAVIELKPDSDADDVFVLHDADIHPQKGEFKNVK